MGIWIPTLHVSCPLLVSMPRVFGSVAHILMLSMRLPTHHIPISWLAHIPELPGAHSGTSPNFATSAQLKTMLLTVWLEASRCSADAICSCHCDPHLTTNLSVTQISEEYFSPLLTLWTVRYQVLLLILKQGYEHSHRSFHSFINLFNHPFNKCWPVGI